MRLKQFGLTGLFAITGTAVAIGAAPIAVADECNPIATVCRGPDVQTSGYSLDAEPPAVPDIGGAPSEMGLTGENDMGSTGDGGHGGR